MRNSLLALAILCISIVSNAQNGRLMDQPMKIKKFNAQVKADCFTAITTIEIEFYNNRDQEIEGAYFFRLEPGQVITAMQLDLNGEYRDATIEERWKAANAYNTIVGKRVDPALLQQTSNDQYRLNIYPVPAKSSRKITMTVHQLLREQNGSLRYQFPIVGADSIYDLNLSIQTGNCHVRPASLPGLLANEIFTSTGNGYTLTATQRNIKLPVDIGFTISTRDQTMLNTMVKDGKKYFALRFSPELKSKAVKAESILVYWDASLSASKRDRSKEIAFLKTFIQANHASYIGIIRFSDQLEPLRGFETDGRWENYLQSGDNDGGTRLDILELSSLKYDVSFLFSDGRKTTGSQPKIADQIPLFTVSSVAVADNTTLKQMTGHSGGKFIDLFRLSVLQAVAETSNLGSDILSVVAATPNTKFKIERSGSSVMVYGSYENSDRIFASYGNYQSMHSDQFALEQQDNGAAVDRIDMLLQYKQMMNSYDWNKRLEFGLEEKVVTSQTSFIVLERVEDYIRYNIEPPKELEAECREKGFVKKSSREEREKLKQSQEYARLTGVMTEYNRLLATFGVTYIPYAITRESYEEHVKDVETKNIEVARGLEGRVYGLTATSDEALSEVVVTTGYGARKAKEVGYASSKIAYNEITQGNAVNVQTALTGKVSGLNVTTVNNGVFENTRLTLRGIRSLTGNNQPLLVFDGAQVPLRYLNNINPNDIQDITILKGATAAAIYGSEGVNGVIIVTSRKARNTNAPGKYRLQDMPEEVYIQLIAAAPLTSKMQEYQSMKKVHGHKALFHLEIAMHLYTAGLKQEARKALLNAAEVGDGNIVVMRALGYIYEQWGELDEAIRVYEDLRTQDRTVVRDLAWAYYQAGKKQQAVDVLYAVITDESTDYRWKAYLADDMNAIIASSKGINTSRIQKEFLVVKPVALKLMVSGNAGNIQSMTVKAPDNSNAKPEPDTYTGYYYGYPNIFQFKDPMAGKYKVSVQYSDWSGSNLPELAKLMVIRNFGTAKQTIEIQNYILNNQHGSIEIAEVNWSK